MRRLLWRTRRLCNHSCCPLTSINNVHSVLASDACHLIPPLPLHTHTPPPHPPTTALRVASRCTNRPTHPAPPPLPCSNLLAALLPAKGKFVPDEEELQERPKGPLQDPRISILEPKVRAPPGVAAGREWERGGKVTDKLTEAKHRQSSAPAHVQCVCPPPSLLQKFFGVKGFGFTKENELFVGRQATEGWPGEAAGLQPAATHPPAALLHGQFLRALLCQWMLVWENCRSSSGSRAIAQF